MSITRLFLIVSAQLVFISGVLAQGSLTPPGAPGQTMKTLEQVEARTPISSVPYTIQNPGSYYVAADLNGIASQHGITINSDDVTLDLNGFTLQGVPGSLDGITVVNTFPDHVNITIENGVLRDWGGEGLDAAWGSNGVVRAVKAVENASHGIRISDTWIVKDCHAIANGSIGIYANDNCLISDCVATGNSSNGVKVVSVCIVRDCVIQKNGASGLRVQNDNRIIGNTVDDNDRDGIRITSGDTRVEGNHVTDNEWRGIAATSAGALIIRNTAAGNDTNYFFAANNRHGPIVDVRFVNGDISGTANSDHPWANFEF